MMPLEPASSEQRALLEQRANVRMARLERLVDAIGRRRVSTVREVVLGVKLAGFAIAVLAVVTGVAYVHRRARRVHFIHRLASGLERLA
jgi:hypothetical protein